jgi:hypothetical protein
MYEGVPQIVSAKFLSFNILPRPKSESFIVEISLSLFLKRRFYGFISRCIIPS